MDFDTLVERVLKREGGYVNNKADRGGATNFGISKRANPDVDVENLTREEAKRIYRERYWDPLNADELPEDVRDLAFDTAVMHGVGTAKKWLAASGGDKAALLAQRREALVAQAKQPGQQQFLKGWMNRLGEFGADLSASARATPVAQGVQALAARLTGTGIILPSVVAAEEQEREADFAKTQEVGFFDAAEAAMGDPRVYGLWSIAEAMNRPDKDPEFSYWDAPEREQWEKAVQNEDELEFLRENATSADGAKWALERITTRRNLDKEVYGRAGPWASFFGQATASLADPVGMAASLGVGKVLQVAKIGSVQLARAGRLGAASGAVLAEGAAGNVAFELLQDALGESKSAADYAAAAAVGAAFSGLAVPGLRREAQGARLDNVLHEADVETKAVADKLTADAVQVQAEARAKGLTPEQVEASQAAELKRTVDDAVTLRPDEDSTDVAVPKELADELRVEEGDVRPQAAAPADPQVPAMSEAVQIADLDAQAEAQALNTELVQVTGRMNELIDPEGNPPPTGSDLRAEYDTLNQRLYELEERLIDENPQAELMGPGGESFKLSGTWAQAAREAFTAGRPMASLRDALTAALDSPAAKASGAAFATIAELLKNLPAKVLDNTLVTFVRPFERGAYNLDARAIRTPSTTGDAAGLGLAEGRNQALVLAHEAVHAATAQVIRAVQAGVDGLPQVAKQSVQRLDELRRELAAWLDTNRPGWQRAEGAGYATQNVDEFVAQAMTDHATKKALMDMPGRGYQADNGWAAFKRAIRGLLGLPTRKVNPQDAWSEAVDLIGTLIDVQGKLPDGIVFGGDLFAPGPQGTRTTVKFSERMYQHARDWLTLNPVNQERLQVLAQQTLKKGSALRDLVLSDGLKMAASNNPIVQMLAGLVTETTTGAVGRRSTAAIKKEMLHQKIVGNSVVDYHAAYRDWRGRNGGGWVEDIRTGDKKRAFDKEVYVEILNRRYGNPSNPDAAIRTAADSLERLFQRSLDTQRQAATLGSHYLPTDSTGYVPQALNGDALREADADTINAIKLHLSKHWNKVYGWDRDFTDTLADKYLWRVRRRAAGERSVDFVATESTYRAIQDTLEEMKLEDRSVATKAEAALERLGAQPQARRRLDVDLLSVLPNGKQLLDFYSTDVEVLARQHANRVAGAAALAERNILGQRGINNLLRAIDDAPPGLGATVEERAAVERVFAEFMGTPWAGEKRSRFAANIAGFTRLQRLGGLGFTQLAETAQLVHHLGFGAALKAVPELTRMVGEIRKLRKGAVVDNKWLSSIETHQGFEFGMSDFRMIAALDAPDELLRQYGKGSDIATRAIAAGNHAQNALSFFRGLHSAQHRMTAEMILKRAVQYIQDGASGQPFLDDMGINPKLAQAIRNDLPALLIKDKQGNVVGFDITQSTSARAAEDLIQAIHRGTAQIIQGNFIGERGAWAHNDVAKLFLQLRTFGLTSMEKQWGRVRTVQSGGALNGYGYAAGVLIGQMAMALPIYLTRVAVYAAGRDDAEDFIARATTPASMIQALMNYTAMSGLASDAFDMVASMAGGWSDDAKQALGTRSFATGVGGLVPAFGSVDAGLRVLQGKADLHTTMKQLPFSNLPFVAPVINLVKSD